jgi:hypothetical protein
MEWKIPKRYFKLNLFNDEKENRTTFADWDITNKVLFNTSDSVSGGFSEANIVLTGLTPEIMGYLASTSTQWLATAVNNKIVIDAGYENQHNIIFSGTIVEAKPNVDSANYTLTLKAQSMFFNMLNNTKSYSFSGVKKASEIANTFAQDLGFVFINSLDKDVDVTDYNLADHSIQANIRYLAQITGLDVYTNNNRLYIKESGKAINSSTVPELTVDSSNMLGSPKITPQGVEVNIKMDPSVITGQKVKIVSERFDIINTQKYILQSINFSGDTRGADWMTHLVLIREDLFGVQ